MKKILAVLLSLVLSLSLLTACGGESSSGSGSASGDTADGYTIGAVSYTHLDVYKRQSLRAAPRQSAFLQSFPAVPL